MNTDRKVRFIQLIANLTPGKVKQVIGTNWIIFSFLYSMPTILVQKGTSLCIYMIKLKAN